MTTRVATPAASTSGRNGETLFGVHTESTATTAAVAALLALAAVVAAAGGRRRPLLGVALLAGVLAVLDAREALHQHDEARATLVVAALALAVAHLGAMALALSAYRREAAHPPPRATTA